MKGCKRAITALFVLAAAPAAAATRDDAGCVAGHLSETEVMTIVDEALIGRSEQTMGVLLLPLQACARDEGWTPRRGADAAGLAIGLLVHDRLGRRLVEHGIDVAALDRWFSGQTLEVRTTIFRGMDDAAKERVFAGLVDVVSAEAMARDGASIGGYLSALMIIERVERGMGL